ncbi:MAG: hypothetical protein A2253_06450 [Deltaproteobacteria bacterium RIFOXYA2_FULL_55_11]|nr:MAG: hypothetical protein A2253_06450 [Deltaproteobacteria bacterium RIFOXYA2_FULL_55_11]
MALFVFLHSLSLWLHVISLGLWIGGIVFFLFVFGPAVHALPPATAIRVLDRGRRSFQSLSWIAIGLLVITGTCNLIFRGAGSQWQFGSAYYSILAIKLFLFLAMLLHQSFQTFKYAPEIAALTAQISTDIQSRFDPAQSSTEAHSKSRAELVEAWPEPLSAHWKKWFLLLKINATLGPIVLLLGLGLSRS